MTQTIPLARADYRRDVAKEARVLTRNRYFEQNPVLTEDPTALIARPGMKRAIQVGEGPIRFLYSQPGTFDEDLFTVSGLDLYRVSSVTLAATLLGTIGTVVTDSVSMVATANIGETPGHLFICDGGVLWCYTEDGYATDYLTATGAIANAYIVVIDGVYYKWTNASVDAGTPLGTVAFPWLVKLGVDAAESLQNLFEAINGEGEAGVTYSTALDPNPNVLAYNSSATQLFVRAVNNGISGNVIAVSKTGANIIWNSATLAGGGAPSLLQVPMPDDVGAISLGYIASYVIVIPAQGQGVNGRFYWINPGETTIDPFDFATAERSPDAVYQVVVFGDQFWLPGQSTTEVWYPSGDPDAPMVRTQGIVFDSGCWQGTAIQVKTSLITVDSDGRVYQISGQSKPISTPDIEERIREAMALQRISGF